MSPLAVAAWLAKKSPDRRGVSDPPPFPRVLVAVSIITILLSAVLGWGLVRMSQVVWAPTDVKLVDNGGHQRRPPAPTAPPSPSFGKH